MTLDEAKDAMARRQFVQLLEDDGLSKSKEVFLVTCVDDRPNRAPIHLSGKDSRFWVEPNEIA